MWEELEHYTIYQPSYGKDATESQKHVEEIQIFEFLASLNSEYEHVRVQILGKEPLPSLNEVYLYIHKEERHRGIMKISFFVEKSSLYLLLI